MTTPVAEDFINKKIDFFSLMYLSSLTMYGFLNASIASATGEITKVESKELIEKLEKQAKFLMTRMICRVAQDGKWDICVNSAGELRSLGRRFTLDFEDDGFLFRETIVQTGNTDVYSVFMCELKDPKDSTKKYIIVSDVKSDSPNKGTSYFRVDDGAWYCRSADATDWKGLALKVDDYRYTLLTSSAHHDCRKFMYESVLDLMKADDVEITATVILSNTPAFCTKFDQAKLRLRERLRKLPGKK